MSFKKISELPLASSLEGDELVPIVQGGVTKRAPASGLIPADVVRSDDPRLSDPRTPTGGAGGVLSGNYPNPGFAVDMATQAELDAVNAAKVDKVAGKGLSTEDYTTAEKNKLAGIASGATANATDAQLRDRATHTGSQAISTVTGLQAELDAVNAAKVDKVAGKGLSTEDYTTAEKNKLAGVAAGATANATDAQLRDRATHTGSQAISTVTGLQGALDAKEAAGTAATAVSSHVAAGDPHPQYTTAAEAAAAAPVQSVAGKTGAVTLAKADVGLSNVDNTADSAKPVSTAQAAAIATATAIHPFLLIGA